MITALVSSRTSGFNPRTHEECDHPDKQTEAHARSFNPRTHEECDMIRFAASSVG